MEIEFDPAKDAANVRKHGISLARAADFRMLTLDRIEGRGELRLKALGVLDGELHAMIFVFRRNAVRIISLRRAHSKELDNG